MDSHEFDGQQRAFFVQQLGDVRPIVRQRTSLDVDYSAIPFDSMAFTHPLPSTALLVHPLLHDPMSYVGVGHGPSPLPQQHVPVYDPDPYPDVYPVPLIGSSEHPYWTYYTGEQIDIAYPPQAFRPRSPSPSSSSLFNALGPALGIAASTVDESVQAVPVTQPRVGVVVSRVELHATESPTESPPIPSSSQPVVEPSESVIEPSGSVVGPSETVVDSSGHQRITWVSPTTPGEPSPSEDGRPGSAHASWASDARRLARKPPFIACLYCRGRKIACGKPLHPEKDNKTCNQCTRRNLACFFPTESNRGRRRKTRESGTQLPAAEPW